MCDLVEIFAFSKIQTLLGAARVICRRGSTTVESRFQCGGYSVEGPRFRPAPRTRRPRLGPWTGRLSGPTMSPSGRPVGGDGGSPPPPFCPRPGLTGWLSGSTSCPTSCPPSCSTLRWTLAASWRSAHRTHEVITRPEGAISRPPAPSPGDGMFIVCSFILFYHLL